MPPGAEEVEEIELLRRRLSALEPKLLDERPTATGHTEERRLQESNVLSFMWLLICGALVMFMQAGFAMLQCGSVREQSRVAVLLKTLVDLSVGSLAWFITGYAIAFGVDLHDDDPSTFAGTKFFWGTEMLKEDLGESIVAASRLRDWFFQWGSCAIVVAIASGGVAERVQLLGYIVYSAGMAGIIYPFVVYWAWSGQGWLSIGKGTAGDPNGYSDLAGSGVVHLTGGVGALVGAVIVGPRSDKDGLRRFELGADALEFRPHNRALVVLGTLVLWFGWYGLHFGTAWCSTDRYGFNCGYSPADLTTVSEAAVVAVNTTLAAATGGLTALLFCRRSDAIPGMCKGVLAGLVAVGAGVGAVAPGAAIATGILGALASQATGAFVRSYKVDDPLDAFAVHGGGGIMGLLVRPLFDRRGGQTPMFWWHVAAILSISAWVTVWSVAILLPLQMFGHLRTKGVLPISRIDNKSEEEADQRGPATQNQGRGHAVVPSSA
jgi:Amt family ammonium transporter